MPEPPVAEQLTVTLCPSVMDCAETVEVLVRGSGFTTLSVKSLFLTVPVLSFALTRTAYVVADLGVILMVFGVEIYPAGAVAADIT